MKEKIAKKSQYETIASTTVHGERTQRAGFEGRGKVKKTDLEHTLTVKNESADSDVSKTNDKSLIAAGAGGAVVGKSLRSQKRIEKDEQHLSQDNWLARNGHSLTYVGIFLFTLVLYFRPYELIPALSGFHSIALIFAVATLLVYLPSQVTTEGTLTALPIEVKCVLFIAVWALLTIPLAKNPRLAWETYNDTFIKVVLMFIIMVNTLRTSARLKGLMWLGIGVGVMLSFQALDLYSKGEFKTEGYRVSVDFGGMFGNPNDMAIHLVIFIPIAVALGAAASNKFVKLLFFACAAMMTAGSFVTQSRGAFLGIVTVGAVLVWKLGHAQRFKAVLIAGSVGLVVILLAPGNYGLRVMSIFIPSLDPVGSSDQRTELLIRSIWVTLRNPLGIGIGNFEIVGSHNLGTHNAFTQVSSELGWLAFAAYMVLLVSPFRKLGAIERQMFEKHDLSWIYYLSIGIQASIAGFMASSFFSSVAYHWYIYYPIAYAIGIRRIYQMGQEESTPLVANESVFGDRKMQHA
jgi:putative inorganic carbon (hco3(-)) transporter